MSATNWFNVVILFSNGLMMTSCVFDMVSCEYNTTYASNLEDTLLTGYHTMVRPSNFVPVEIGIGIYHITSLSNIDEELSLVGFLVVWSDARLAWEQSSYGDMRRTYFTTSQIWTPPITLANSANGIRLLSDDSDTKTIPLLVNSDGEVTWLAAANYLVKCNVDITYYPFDSQSCDIKVSTWLYGSSEISLINSENDVNVELYDENGEWDLKGTSAFSSYRSLHGHPMAMVEFKVILSRKHSYYILNMILPVVLTSLLGCLVFLLPMESGEKNGFALTILLSLSVVMTTVSDKIPPTSTHVCILSVYLLCALSICVLEVLVIVFLQRIHSKTSAGARVKGRLQTIAGYLAKIAHHKRKKRFSRLVNGLPHHHGADYEIGCATSGLAIFGKIQDGDGYQNDEGLSTPRSLKKSKIHPDEMRHQSEVNLEIDNSRLNVRQGGKAENINDIRPKPDAWPVIYNYKDISVCLDKICFYVFFLFTFILTLAFLLVLSEGTG